MNICSYVNKNRGLSQVNFYLLGRDTTRLRSTKKLSTAFPKSILNCSASPPLIIFGAKAKRINRSPLLSKPASQTNNLASIVRREPSLHSAALRPFKCLRTYFDLAEGTQCLKLRRSLF